MCDTLFPSKFNVYFHFLAYIANKCVPQYCILLCRGQKAFYLCRLISVNVFLYHKGMPNVVLLIKSFFLLMWKYIFLIQGKHELTADLQVICSEWNVASLLSQSRPPGGGELVEGGGGGRAAPMGGGRGGAALPGVGGRVRSWDSSRYVLYEYKHVRTSIACLPSGLQIN